MKTDWHCTNTEESVAQLLDKQLSEKLSSLSGSLVKVQIIDKPMSNVHIVKATRTKDGFVVCIDRKEFDARRLHTFKHRVPPVLALLRQDSCTARQTTIDFGDRSNSHEAIIGFCSRSDERSVLVPDYGFLSSYGYEKLRHWAIRNTVPWKWRSDVILWRGSATGNTDIARNFENRLPRIQMCMLARKITQTDLKIVRLTQTASAAESRQALIDDGVMTQDRLPVESWAGHKFAIDIDGNTNSFGTMLSRQILGCCVLKVLSYRNWRQWFYGEIKPWVHYVPVKSDLSDLSAIIAWCRDHDEECRKIAEQGRAFAIGLDYNAECKSAINRINTAFAE